MKKEIADMWVAALRSGEYTQGRFTLRTSNDKFCCLGVLCDLAIKNKISLICQLEGNAYAYNYQRYGLPNDVMHWAGIKTSDGYLSSGDSLMRLNDNGENTFNEIADIIETNYELL